MFSDIKDANEFNKNHGRYEYMTQAEKSFVKNTLVHRTYFVDVLHPNDAGYERIADLLEKFLNNL